MGRGGGGGGGGHIGKHISTTRIQKTLDHLQQIKYISVTALVHTNTHTQTNKHTNEKKHGPYPAAAPNPLERGRVYVR